MSLLWFCVSGVLALMVDIAVLYGLQGAMGHYGARLVSFWCAATFTWVFNRSITFKGPKPASMAHEYLGYLSSMALGGMLNYGVYAAAVRWIPVVASHPALGVAMGSLAGLTFNYLSAKRILRSAL